MFTAFDKALVAFIMGALFIINYVLGTNYAIDPATLGNIIAVLTPILVWLVPNKAAGK